MFTELYKEEKREEGDRGGQEDNGGESKGERQIQPVNQFPKCSPPSIQNTQRDSQSWVEKGEEGDRGDLVEKKESPQGERAVKPVISLPSKNGY